MIRGSGDSSYDLLNQPIMIAQTKTADQLGYAFQSKAEIGSYNVYVPPEQPEESLLLSEMVVNPTSPTVSASWLAVEFERRGQR